MEFGVAVVVGGVPVLVFVHTATPINGISAAKQITLLFVHVFLFTFHVQADDPAITDTSPMSQIRFVV